MTNVEELERALEFPWEKWTVFLHPEQRDLVERDYSGPARVSGSAGTGKTIVALHRAVHLARTHPQARVLLTTFSDTLAHALQAKLRRLLTNEPRLGERIDVHSLGSIGARLYKSHIRPATIATAEVVRDLISKAAAAIDHKFSSRFLIAEWDQIVDAWQLRSWEAYRDVARLGRKTRLPEPQRKVLWSIFERVQAELQSMQLITWPELFNSLAAAIGRDKRLVFDFAVVDEAQDVNPAHLRFWRRSAATVRTPCSLRAIWGSAFSSSPFPGSRWVSISGALANPACQLSDVTPDLHSGRPPAGSFGHGRRWQHGEAGRRNLGLQWSRAKNPCTSGRRRRVQGGRTLDR